MQGDFDTPGIRYYQYFFIMPVQALQWAYGRVVRFSNSIYFMMK